jgi:hypothetical protein
MKGKLKLFDENSSIAAIKRIPEFIFDPELK